MRAGHEALGKRGVLGVHGSDLSGTRALADERAADDEGLLVGEGERASGLEGPQRGKKPRCSRESVEDDIAGPARELGRLGLAEGHVGHAVAARLVCQEVRLAASCREAHDAEALGVALDDVEGLAPDGARAAEDDDVSSLGHGPIVLRSSL